MSRGPMSDNEKMAFIFLLCPFLWPFVPAILVGIGVERIAEIIKRRFC